MDGSSNGGILDPWKSTDISIPAPIQQRQPSSMSTNSVNGGDDDIAIKDPNQSSGEQGISNKLIVGTGNKKSQEQEYARLKERLWSTAATSDSNQLSEILDTFRINHLPFLSATPGSAWQQFLDSKNGDGSSALHVAACFGQREICWLLISHGATIDIQDKHGWTPLVWASNNAREDVVRLLIEQGATSTQSLGEAFSNMSVGQYIKRTTAEVDPTSDFAAVLKDSGLRNKSNSTIGDGFYRAATFDFDGLDRELTQTIGSGLGSGTNAPIIDGDDEYEESATQLHYLLNTAESQVQLFGGSSMKSPTLTASTFDWSQCLPHQMYVFDLRQVERLSDTLVAQMTTPHITQSSVGTKLASAVTLFLCVRYAHYYGSVDLMNLLFESCVEKLKAQLPKRRNDMCFLAYWLANTSQIVYFLKRDPGLLHSSVVWQVRWSELVQDIFNLIVDDAKSRLETIWRQSLMDYESIPGGNGIQWDPKRKTISATGKRRSFSSRDSLNNSGEVGRRGGGWFSSMFGGAGRRKKSDPAPAPPMPGTYGSTGSVAADRPPQASSSDSAASTDQQKPAAASSSQATSPISTTGSAQGGGGFSFSFMSANIFRPKPPLTLSPRSVSTLLSSILFVMQSYQSHPSFQLQLLRQIFHCIGALMLNCFMLNSNDSKLHYCSRWKAMQIRMNISVMEDWVRFFCIPRASAKQIVKERRGARSAQNAEYYRPGLDDLIYPVLSDSHDDLIQYLKSPIMVCQLLQVATQSFGQVDYTVIENPLMAFCDTLSSLTTSGDWSGADRRDSTASFQLLAAFPYLNAKQLYRIFIDYSYEKDEPLIAQEVIGYLEAHCIDHDSSSSASAEDLQQQSQKQPEKKKGGAAATVQTASTNTVDLMSEDVAAKTDSNVSIPAASPNQMPPPPPPLKKRMSLVADVNYLLPFRLQFVLPTSMSTSTSPVTASDAQAASDSLLWGDKNELQEQRRRKLELERLRIDEEIWWERRMKIEVPDWVMKRI